MDDDVASIDINDPCAVIGYLKLVRLRLIAGEVEIKARFGEDEVTFKASNLRNINAEIARLEPECAAQEGRPVAKSRRAFSARF